MKPPNPKPKSVSPFRLASLLRLQQDPNLALHLFQNPNPNPPSPTKPFRHSLRCYDLIITKLGRAKMFHEMESILLQLKTQTKFSPKEPLFCHIFTFYGRAGLSGNARKLFDEMPQYRCERTIKSFNTMLNVLMNCKEFDAMRDHFGSIERPDSCSFNIMIRGLCSDGRAGDALKVFDEMKKRDLVPNMVTFGSLIYGLCLDFKLKEAFKLKDYMVKVHGVCPNEYVYASLIKGVCGIGEISLAFRLKDEMERNKVTIDSAIYSTLINGLFKFGRKDEALGVLEEMKLKGCKPDTVTYNVLINGFCKGKDFETAYKLLDEMSENGFKPDVISYNVILGELCKDGKSSEANDLFEDMPRRGCAPDVLSYRIRFDGLCDALEFKEAAFSLDEMIFKGFTPRSSSICKFVNKLCQERNMDLLWSVLNSLVKINAIDIDLWKMVVDVVIKENAGCKEHEYFLEKCLRTP
ncbi:putative pentatricopeptide repeat-containing protein At1g53330 [Mercurialis annua]|uniref:putative pentatricopeptide repeat-containing protein At1g53330 n=1 Tax=Mercurialis annua TaxID=3986 RepID=UPI00215E8D77|nr:putative pentatricopeptide repeat-containing protein At1g53330 [Mercurialis annua]